MGNSQRKPSLRDLSSASESTEAGTVEPVFGSSLDASTSSLPLADELPVPPETDQRDPDQSKVPAVIRWENGGKKVSVAGTFSNWEKIPMSER